MMCASRNLKPETHSTSLSSIKTGPGFVFRLGSRSTSFCFVCNPVEDYIAEHQAISRQLF